MIRPDVARSGHCQSRKVRARRSDLLDRKRSEGPEVDGFDGSALRIVKHQRPTSIHFDSCGTLHVEMVIASQLEFQYQVQIVHFALRQVENYLVS